MTNQIKTYEDAMTIVKLEKKVAQLQHQLEAIQLKKASKLEDSLYSPKLFDHYQKVAEMLARTDMIPRNYKGKPSDVFAAMSTGYQLGLPVEQALQNIAVINGTPAIWGDAVIALALSHPACESIDEQPILDDKGNVTGYVCTVVRKGHAPHQSRFTLQDAQRAGLLKKPGPWQQYTSRMLQLRARNFALRDKFADILKGLQIAEIVQDDVTVIDVNPEKQEEFKTQTDNLKETIVDDDLVEEVAEEVNYHELLKEYIESEDFDEVRYLKALDYYDVDRIDNLTAEQAAQMYRALLR